MSSQCGTICSYKIPTLMSSAHRVKPEPSAQTRATAPSRPRSEPTELLTPLAPCWRHRLHADVSSFLSYSVSSACAVLVRSPILGPFRVRFEFCLKRWFLDWVPKLLDRLHNNWIAYLTSTSFCSGPYWFFGGNFWISWTEILILTLWNFTFVEVI